MTLPLGYAGTRFDSPLMSFRIYLIIPYSTTTHNMIMDTLFSLISPNLVDIINPH